MFKAQFNLCIILSSRIGWSDCSNLTISWKISMWLVLHPIYIVQVQILVQFEHTGITASTSQGFLKYCYFNHFYFFEQQTQILNKMSDIFSKLLSDSHTFIVHMVLEAFTKFAEETVHESVVPQCFVKQPDLQNVMVAFLNKVEERNTHQFVCHVMGLGPNFRSSRTTRVVWNFIILQ